MKVSLRLIMIEEDAGQGKNVRPLAQQEILKIDLADPAKARDATVLLAQIAQEGIMKTLAATGGKLVV